MTTLATVPDSVAAVDELQLLEELMLQQGTPGVSKDLGSTEVPTSSPAPATPPVAADAAVEQDFSSFLDDLELTEFLNSLMSGASGSGGGSASSGSSSGGTGGSGEIAAVASDPLEVPTVGQDEEVLAFLQAQLLAGELDAEVLELDPSFQGESERIIGELDQLAEQQLVDINPELQAELDTIFASQDEQLAKQFEEDQASLIAQLFSQGAEQSTVAGDVGARLLGEQGIAAGALDAEQANTLINTRFQLTDSVTSNLLAQAEINAQAAGVGLAELELAQNTLNSNADRGQALLTSTADRIALLEATTQSNQTSIDTTKISASAQIQAAKIGASATVSAANAHASASRYASELDFGSDLLGFALSDSQFNQNLAFQEDVHADSVDLEQQRIDNELFLGKKSISASTPSTFDKILGVVGTGLGAAGASGGFSSLFSDERLKDNLEEVDMTPVMEQIPPMGWNWKASGEADAGVVAQDVAKVLPFAVSEHESGYKQVDIGSLIGVLWSTVYHLNRRVKALEETS